MAKNFFTKAHIKWKTRNLSKVELLYRDFVILVGSGSGVDTILNLEFFPPKFELIYYLKDIFYICHLFPSS